MHRPTFALSLLALLPSVAAIPGCRTEPVPAYTSDGPPPNQKHPFDEVMQRTKQLRRGMPRGDVLIRLGSPAEIRFADRRRSETWIYMPGRPAFLVPASALTVHFRDGFYVKHEQTPIIFGERVVSESPAP